MYNSFFDRNDSSKCVSPRLGDNAKYRLYKQYNILNNWVALEDQWRAARWARGEASEVNSNPEPSSRRRREKEVNVAAIRPTNTNPYPSKSKRQQLVQSQLLTYQLQSSRIKVKQLLFQTLKLKSHIPPWIRRLKKFLKNLYVCNLEGGGS